MHSCLPILGALAALTGSAVADGKLAEAERSFSIGGYEEATRLARSARPRDDADLLLARIEVRTGRWPEAEKRLVALVARAPHQHAARIELGRCYRRTGRTVDEKAVWNRLFDDYEQGRIDKGSAPQLTAVAVAARHLGSYQDANDLFREAAAVDGAYLPLRLEWAATFLEKYAAGEAEQDAVEALKIAPTDADAHVVMAQVKLEQSYDLPAANREIDLALRRNPRHAEALALRAELLIDNEEYFEAEKLTVAVLAINPRDERAHTLIAAIRLLRDDQKGFEIERQVVLAQNPRASGFFHGVAEFLVKQHRYEEANALEQEALKVAPDDAVALAAIGQNFLRLGDEKQGMEALRRAFKRDGFNVRTYNLLNLFEEVIAKGYDFVEAPPFRIRVPRSERALLEKILPPLVRAEWKELTARYGFAPEGPLQIELYADPQHYAVRTVGLPGLEALGVTFGKVVTGRSPAEGKFNWGMMLWHEIGHVFSIQLSRARVPRWFTEGLAEYETERRNPEWRRHTHAELFAALQGGRLLSVAALNSGFTRARTLAGIVVAYHEAAEAVSFLARRFGFPKVVEALKLFAAGKETPEVLRAVTGLDVAAFDRAFQADLRMRLKAYEGTFFVRPSDYADLEGLADEAKAKPTDARAQAMYGLALLHAAHDAGKAALQIKKALALGETTKEALLASAEVFIEHKDHAGAERTLRRLIEVGGDGFDARMKLGELYARQAKLDDARRELNLAKSLDPESPDPYATLARMYLKANREDEALVELEHAARLDGHDPSLPRLLVEKHAARSRWDRVRVAAAQVSWIDPCDGGVRTHAGRAALALHDAPGAVVELEIALLCKPPRPGAVRGLLARALDGSGDRARARKEAAAALKEEPGNVDARAVMERK
ncbi:MAG: tetratricopeptide repeat protein [Myxococcales bacterium]|nr:tetratricopeptide repeat protein [Myxococcales bacterium]